MNIEEQISANFEKILKKIRNKKCFKLYLRVVLISETAFMSKFSNSKLIKIRNGKVIDINREYLLVENRK